MAILAMLMELFHLTDLLTPLVDAVTEVVYDGASLVSSVLIDVFSIEAELQKLRHIVARIHAVLEDADDLYIRDASILVRLDAVRNVVMDAEDIIEEFDTYLKIEMFASAEGASSSSQRKRKRQWLTLKRPAWLRRWKISVKIKEIQNEIRNTMGWSLTIECPRRTRIPSAATRPSGVGNSPILGIDEKKAQIIYLLKQIDSRITPVAGTRNTCALGLHTEGIGDPISAIRSSNCPSAGTPTVAAPIAGTDAITTDAPVIAVVGAGGIGKTTLARWVFDDPKVESYTKIWIDITRESDEYMITEEIIEFIKKSSCAIPNKRKKSSCEPRSLESLQYQLRKLIWGKKYLLVLDGVQAENLSFWETLREPLKFGAKGSAILATARSTFESPYCCPLATISLTGLQFDDSFSLFQHQVFGQDAVDTDLVEIGKQIVNKCHGSPLAIISMGSLLCGTRDVQQWLDVLDDMPDCEDAVESISLTLKISYGHLPYHLKQCFTFCSIFPNGYEFDKEELVKIWIAVGLIKHRARNLSPENTAYNYFEHLLSRSFFQTTVGHENINQKYKIPGLVHELLQTVCGFECLRIENDVIPSGESRKSRYALLYDCNMEQHVLSKINQNIHLRVLISLCNQSSISTRQIPYDFFHNFKVLRALDLRNHELKEVPPSIGDLIHLRYLNLYGTPISTLPDSLCMLYNLQVLELGNCNNLSELPQDLSNLINLRHLGLHLDLEECRDNWKDFKAMPPGISRLTSLRTLSRFAVSSESECSSIKELKDLNLQGEICISKLENIVEASDVKEACIQSKRYLENMILRWTGTSNPREGVAEEVIENLCPPTKLKTLWIMNYPGNEFPKWLENQHLNIESLRLSNCGRCKRLPLLGNLPKLKFLYLEGLHNVENIPALGSTDDNSDIGFPSLEVLHLSEMNSLEDLFIPQHGDCLPCRPKFLRKLELKNCPKLMLDPSTKSLLHE